MSELHEWVHEVTAEEGDELGHANNEAYLRWMNRAAVSHSDALGWPTEAYLRRGQGWVVRRHELEYLRSAFPGMSLVVQTWVQTFERASSWRCYAIRNRADGLLLARGRTLWAWIDFQTRRPARVPPEVAAAFPIRPEDVFALKG